MGMCSHCLPQMTLVAPGPARPGGADCRQTGSLLTSQAPIPPLGGPRWWGCRRTGGGDDGCPCWEGPQGRCRPSGVTLTSSAPAHSPPPWSMVLHPFSHGRLQLGAVPKATLTSDTNCKPKSPRDHLRLSDSPEAPQAQWGL